MNGFKNLSKTEIENLSTEDFINLLKQQLLAGPQQIYQFPNKPTVVGNDLFLISSTNSGNITNNTSTSQYLTNYINPNAQLGSVSQVTGLPAILSSIDLQYAYNNTPGGTFTISELTVQSTAGNILLDITDAITAIAATSGVYITNPLASSYFLFTTNSMTNINQDFTGTNIDLMQVVSNGFTGTQQTNSGLIASGFIDATLPSGYLDLRINDSGNINTVMRVQGTQGNNPACILMGGISSSATISNLSINASSVNYNSLLQLESSTQGWLPPRLTSTQEDTLVALPLSSSDKGLAWYNTTNNINKYWDGLDIQTLLTIDNVIQGSNMVITDNGDGTLTFAATGGSGPSTQVQGSFNANQTIATTTPVTTADTPIVIFPAFFNSINPVGTNVSVATISGVQTAIIQNNSTGGRWCQVDYDLTIYVPTAGQIYTFTIYTNTGATVYFKKYQALGTGPYYDDIAICGKMIYLNTNDYVYLTVNSSSPSGPAISAFYYSGRLIDTSVASLPNTDPLAQGTNNWFLTQNGGTTYQYMSGSAIVGNIPKFNSTGGQFIDSGIAASNIVQNNGSTYGINISGNSATVTTNANLTGPVTSVGNATSITAGSITNAMLAGSIDLTTKVINTLPNANTTATNSNTASAIVARDASGNFSAGTITASLSGTANSATNVQTTSVTSNSSFYPVYASNSAGGSQGLGLNSGFSINPSTNTITASLNGNASTVTNGVYTTGSYSNPSWITSILGSIVSGLSCGNSFTTVSTSSANLTAGAFTWATYSAGQCTLTLPSAPSDGTVCIVQAVSGISSTSGWKVVAQGSDKIQYGSALSAAAGNITSTPNSTTDGATFIYNHALGFWVVPNAGLAFGVN